ncbi:MULTISPECIES: protease modulator HflC [unclassified Sphingobium]|uniref:protease modulator HflC n=1 Tax=unclassified Sphingobium TaxID=2611147 RepID=UPI0022256F86|nr:MULTISPECIES: protease modulator HflC [unclassified Sphingobium]MCW2383255.1 membrane protease subunit HflC [Sphingobium sp. B2D3B]MCW2399770.1 membrane protease subunit HflC [Sphingobium sp. B2D3C]
MNLSLRNPILLAVLATVGLILLASTFSIVPETKQAVVLRFGEPVRIYNAYKPNEVFGNTGAGLKVRLPFVDQVVWIDKRVQSVAMERQQVLSTDQLRLQVDAFARYRIIDPRRMFISAGSETRVEDALRPILGSALRNELGRRRFDLLLSPERSEVMNNITASLNRVARQYGAEIIDVRIMRADLPDGTPLQSAFQRMRTAREQEALTIRAEGARRAQLIRADADAAAAKVYAASFGKDAQFYDFYRAMQSYRTTFAETAPGETSAVLSTDNDYLRQFRGR